MLKLNINNKINDFIKNNWRYNHIAILIIAIHLIITIFLSYKLNIWEDEAYSLHTCSKGLKYAFYQSINFENQPPVYFILLSVWRTLNNSIFFARLFSVLCGLISLIIINKLIKDNISPKASAIFLFLFAFNPYFIWQASEIRVYALVILLSVLNHYVFLLYLKERNLQNIILFITVSIVSIYTQYFLVFITGCQFLLILTKSFITKKYNVRLTDIFFIFLSLLFLIPIIGKQVHYQSITSNQQNLKEYSIMFFRSIIEFIFPAKHNFNNIFLISKIGVLLIFLLSLKKIIIGNLSALKLNLFYQYQLLCIFATLIMFILIHYISPNIFLNKKYLFLIFFSILYVFIFNLNFLKKNWKVISMLFLITVTIISTYDENKDFVRKIDFRSIVHYLDKYEKLDQPILVYRNNYELVLQYFYSGKNKIIPLPSKMSFDKNYLMGFKNCSEIDSTLQFALKNKTKFWLVSDTISNAYQTTFLRREFNTYLSQNFKQLKDTLIGGISIRYFSKY